MYTIYILRNQDHSFHYVGMTNNLERRLHEHLSGYSPTTKKFLPLELVYSETSPNRVLARKREKFFKSGVGREYRKKLIGE